MRLVEEHQRGPPKLARQMDQGIQKQLYKLTTLGELQLVATDYCRDLLLDEPAREQRRVAEIGRQLAARSDQQHVHRLAQAAKLALTVEHDCLNACAFGYQTK